MGKRWQLQEAKNQLSRVVAEAREHGPQTITVHGEVAAVVLSAEEYRKLVTPRESLVEFFRRSPLRGARLRVTRSRDSGRRRVTF
jgi:prevent-host-death family protein